jgi:hypothetical protein
MAEIMKIYPYYLTSLVLTNYPNSLIWQSPSKTLDNSQVSQVRFLPANSDKTKRPDSKGTPPTTVGTGSRGNCLEKEIPLTALAGTKPLDLTMSKYPTFWIYVPYSAKEAPFGEFSLQDGAENDVYRTKFALPATPGTIAISLPSSATALEVDRKYRWYLKINCPRPSDSLDEFSTPAFVTGQIQRTLPTSELETQLKTAKTALDRTKVYAQHGIWYDTLTELTSLDLTQPDLAFVWTNLLQDAGLGKVARQPVIGSITPINTHY